jgi:integrase/recombinase XerD
MKLGSLLLKGFQSRKKKAPAARAKTRVQTAPSRSPRTRTIAKGPAPAPKNTSVILAPALKQRHEPILMQTADLIRPNDQLKKSIESFLLDQRSEHTKRAYGKDLKRFVKFLIDRKLRLGVESIDRAMIIAYKDQLLSENLNHTTVDRHLASLRSFFRWLVEDGVLEKNPAENVRFLNPKRESPTKGFTDSEVQSLLNLPDLHRKTGALHYAVLMVLFYCGLRRSELCELRTSNIGFERGHHFIRLKGKGNAERIVVLIEPVWNALQHYLKITRKDINYDQPLFSPVRNNRTLVHNKPLDPSMIFYIVTRYAKRAGIQNKVSPHSCRATAISNARDHQVPDRAIQEFAGWSTTTMITRYDKRKSAIEHSAVHAISYGDETRDLPSPSLIERLNEKP